MPEFQTLPSTPIVMSRDSKMERDIRSTVETSMKQNLGLKTSQKLPDDVAAMINSAAATAAAKSVELQVTKAAAEAAATVTKADVLARFDDKARLASQGILHISKSSEVDEILKKRAEMLAAKKAALEAAGFTPDDAMSILLADIAARGH